MSKVTKQQKVFTKTSIRNKPYHITGELNLEQLLRKIY